MPTIEIVKDFDGYFERLVRSWMDRKVGPFKHHTIRINAGPYRPDAVTYISKDGVMILDFYSAIRNGFGGLSESEVLELIELL